MCEIAETVSIPNERVQNNFNNSFDMKKLLARMSVKLVTVKRFTINVKHTHVPLSKRYLAQLKGNPNDLWR